MRNMYRIIIGGLLIVSGAATVMASGIGGTLLLAAGFAFLITGILRHRRYGDGVETDERSRRIGAYGLSYAWLTGLFFMTALFWLEYTGTLALDAATALAISIIVLALSAVLYQAYLFRKGDVD